MMFIFLSTISVGLVATRRKLFGTNGIRGVPRKDLTLEFFLEMAQSLSQYFGSSDVMLGHDGRTSSPTLARAVWRIDECRF